MNQTRITATLLVLLVVGAGLPAPVAATGGVQSQDCSYPVTITDAQGTEVTVEEEPQRIISLNPSAAQTLWEIGAQDKVVGMSEYASYLEGADEKEIVNTQSGGINVEKIIELEPDLVIAPGTISEETVRNLRDKGITVAAFETPQSIDGVAEKTTQIGRITGHCEGAAETNDWMRSNVEQVEEAVADAEQARSMYVFYGYTVGTETFIHDMMTSAGMTNIMAEAGVSGYAQVNKEIVRDRNPEWIIVNSGDPGVPDDPAYNETIAVQEDQIVAVEIEYMNQPGPRSVVNAVHTLASEIHPDAMEGVEVQDRSEFEITTTTTTTTTTAEEPTTTTTTTPEQTTEAESPGFGVAAGILALLAGLLLTRR